MGNDGPETISNPTGPRMDSLPLSSAQRKACHACPFALEISRKPFGGVKQMNQWLKNAENSRAAEKNLVGLPSGTLMLHLCARD